MASNPIKPWLERLRLRFSPRRILLGNDGSQPLPGGENQALTCVVARELCLFLEVDAGRIPDKKRQSFVELAVRRAAPFPDPGFGLAWMGDHAAVWYWSRQRVLDLLGGQWPRRIRCVPEALFTGSPTEDGVELLALSSGFEGRIWKDHHLVASRWWNDLPDETAWRAFLRGAGRAAQVAVPDPEPAAVVDRQWSASGPGRSLPLAGLEQYLPRIALGAGAVFLLVVGFQSGSMLRAAIDIARAKQAAQTLDAPLARILDARERADAHATSIRTFLSLRSQPPQLRLMAEGARVMEGKEWQLRMWHQPTPERIEVTVSMARPDPEALVTAWEASPLFQGVTTELSRQQNEVTIRADITPLSTTTAEAAP